MNKFASYKNLIEYYEQKARDCDVDDNSIAFLVNEYLGLKNVFLYEVINEVITQDCYDELITLLEQYTANKIPVQHLLGFAYFYGYQFLASPNALIPRCETETLVENILFYYDKYFDNRKINVLDLGCGSGCIGLTLALEEKNMEVVLSDVSLDALEDAKKNNQKLGANISHDNFIYSSWFDNIKPEKPYDIIVSNPPYVTTLEKISDVVQKEPSLALYGGVDGVIFYEKIINFLKDNLDSYLNKECGLLCFEHGFDQGYKISSLLKEAFRDEKVTIYSKKDYQGRIRTTYCGFGSCLKGEPEIKTNTYVGIIPTETVYGLFAPLDCANSIEKIYGIKKRDAGKPLALACNHLDEIAKYFFINDDIRKVAAAFFPGKLTLIVEATPKYERLFKAKTVGVRISSSYYLQKYIKTNGPIFLTSLNESGQKEINDIEEIFAKYYDLVDVLYSNDEIINKTSKTPTTIFDMSIKPYKIIREGEVTLAQIQKALA